MDNLSAFVENIQYYIAKEGISLNQFSLRIGVAERAVSNWIKMEYFPTVESAVKVANLLNYSLDYLFGLSEDNRNNNNLAEFSKNIFLMRFEGLCKANNYTAYKISKACNFGEGMFSKWKAGKYPKTETIIKLAAHFDCSIEFLIGRSDNK